MEIKAEGRFSCKITSHLPTQRDAATEAMRGAPGVRAELQSVCGMLISQKTTTNPRCPETRKVGRCRSSCRSDLPKCPCVGSLGGRQLGERQRGPMLHLFPGGQGRDKAAGAAAAPLQRVHGSSSRSPAAAGAQLGAGREGDGDTDAASISRSLGQTW